MKRVQTYKFVVLELALVVSLVAPLALPLSSHAHYDDASLVSTATPEGRLAVFDDLWETIEDRYYDPRFNGVNWQAKRTTFRPAAMKATSTHEFYELMRQMIASLRDAHTRVYSPDEKFDWWNPRFVTVGLGVREIGGVPVVTQVEPNSAAAKANIRAGDVIVSVDNVPVAKFIEQRLENAGAGVDERTRYRSVASMFDGPAGTSVQVAWSTQDGKVKSAVLQRYWTQRELGFSMQRKGKLAILRIDAFTQSVALDFSKALPSAIEGAEGIVLDLRANGGGDAEAMADVASLFLDDGINLGRFADRSGAAFELQTYSKRLWRVPQLSQIKLPLVVLTSESTSSAAEIMVAALQARRRARVIGSGTCGCVLAIRTRHALPDGGVLDVSEFDYRTASGARLQDVGITPDEFTRITRSDIYSHRDPTLAAAKKFLESSPKSESK
ncbi:MAG TPA: S41 family peptidase [Pyrinomonadaceae bacterium]|nr:S41 family peptidase [Pyrinomonadaceae bacterium]